jgi:hypothetical protein
VSAVPRWRATADSIQVARWQQRAFQLSDELQAERAKASAWWRQLKAAGLEPETPDPPEGKVFPSGGVLRDQGMDDLYTAPVWLNEPEVQ